MKNIVNNNRKVLKNTLNHKNNLKKIKYFKMMKQEMTSIIIQ